MARTALMWFRRDLRLTDNLALAEALRGADVVVPVFLLPAEEPAARPSAASASRAWLMRSLEALDDSLRARGSRLVLRAREMESVAASLARIAEECGAAQVFASRDWDPVALAEEDAPASGLRSAGIELAVHEGQLLVPPVLRTAQGTAYRVFTPFFRAWEQCWSPAEPVPAPEHIPPPERWPDSLPLPEASFGSPPRPIPGSQSGCAPAFTPGEAGALRRLDEFASCCLADYDAARDRPDLSGTSELSAHLCFGELSPNTVAARVARGAEPQVARAFLRQLAWREFAYHTLGDFPALATRPWHAEYSAMPWRSDEAALSAWREGRTGYPLVDAGMRQLAATGWMHNRVRLIAASFLTKHLLLPWQDGERFFREQLADWDPAANAFNWQWVAGSGADAAPYFRIFNPSLQGSRFDPDGAYIRQWVPELAALPAIWIHRPWEAPAEELSSAGVTLGTTYPAPIVDHHEARMRALAALECVKAAR